MSSLRFATFCEMKLRVIVSIQDTEHIFAGHSCLGALASIVFVLAFVHRTQLDRTGGMNVPALFFI